MLTCSLDWGKQILYIGIHDIIGAPIGGREESWSLVLRGSRRTLELLRQLPEAFRDDVLVPGHKRGTGEVEEQKTLWLVGNEE